MEIKEECLAYLGQYYKELFFGTANKRLPFHDKERT